MLKFILNALQFFSGLVIINLIIKLIDWLIDWPWYVSAIILLVINIIGCLLDYLSDLQMNRRD